MAEEGLNDEGLAGVISELMADPATARPLQRLIKQKRPDISIPEIELEDAFEERLRAQRSEDAERIEKLEARVAASDFARNRAAQWDEAREQHGLSEGDLPAVEKLIEEDGFSTIEAAARYLGMQRQVESAGAQDYSASGLEDEGLKPFLVDPAHADRLAHQIVEEQTRGNFH